MQLRILELLEDEGNKDFPTQRASGLHNGVLQLGQRGGWISVSLTPLCWVQPEQLYQASLSDTPSKDQAALLRIGAQADGLTGRCH